MNNKQGWLVTCAVYAAVAAVIAYDFKTKETHDNHYQDHRQEQNVGPTWGRDGLQERREHRTGSGRKEDSGSFVRPQESVPSVRDLRLDFKTDAPAKTGEYRNQMGAHGLFLSTGALSFTSVWGMASLEHRREPRGSVFAAPPHPQSKSTPATASGRPGSGWPQRSATPAKYSRQALHRLYAETCSLYSIRWSKAESEAFVKVVWKESRGNPGMRNSRSSSAGLFGFLRGTRQQYQVKLTDTHHFQAEKFLLYCQRRYGSVQGAMAHHRKRGWY